MLSNKQKLCIVLSAIAIIILFGFCYCEALITEDLEEDMKIAIKTIEPTRQAFGLIDSAITFSDYEYEVFYDVELSKSYICDLIDCVKTLDTAINSGKCTITAICEMSAEKQRLNQIIYDMQTDVENYIRWEEEYYYSAKTYEFLKQNGYSDTIACAIIGNMMVETSPYSLTLKPYAQHKSGCHYGLCQWARKYYSQVMGASFEEQLVFLLETMPKEFNRYGPKFKKGFNYDSFLEMTNVKEAALMFAKVYERCGKGSYPARKTCAKMAYEYFVNGNDTTYYKNK